MPVYNFEIQTSEQLRPIEAVNLPNCSAAKLEASKRLATLLQDHSSEIWLDQDWELVVTDEEGLILYVLRLSAQKTAASMFD